MPTAMTVFDSAWPSSLDSDSREPWGHIDMTDPLPSESPPQPMFLAAPTRWSRLRQSSPAELVLFLQAVIVLPLSALALKRWGLSGVQERAVSTLRSSAGAVRLEQDALDTSRRLAWLVEAAARHGPWRANCLQRSVTLWWFLLRRGLKSDLRIGVRRQPESPSGSQLDFHAWIEFRGVVLNDAHDVQSRFATFDRPVAPRNVAWR
jgi:hypothetical protein